MICIYKIKELLLIILTVAAMLAVNIANAQNDTTWAYGTMPVINTASGLNVDSVDVELKAQNVQMINPNNPFVLNSGIAGIVNYNVPVFIDTSSGIGTPENFSKTTTMFPSIGSDFNMSFSDYEQGIVRIINLTGQTVKTESFDGNNYYANLSNLARGVYLINVQTEDGNSFTKKFLKQGNTLSGERYNNLDNDHSTFRLASIFNANYEVKWSKVGFKTDSTLVSLFDGDNGSTQIDIVPLSVDTLWGTGKIGALNSANMHQINNVALTFRPDSVANNTPNTTFNVSSYPGPDYAVPVFIGQNAPVSANSKYWVSWNETGFLPDSASVNIHNGSNSNIFVQLQELPPTVINLEFNISEIRGAPMSSQISDSAFVYIKDMLGNIDSARTDNTGKFKFLDVGQNTTYYYGAGKENHLAWDGDTIITPIWSTPGDTIDITKNLDLIPSDSIHSRKSGSMVAVNANLIGDLFSRYNVQIGRNDTLRFNLSNSYSQIQKNNATAWITNYGLWTGVPTKMENNTFSWPIPNFDPDTSDVSVLGVNITPGTSNCFPVGMLYNGYPISTGANITNSFSWEKQIHKEVGRITFDEAANCFMSPTGNNMNSTGAAHADLIYVLNRAYFNDKHDLPRMTYLTNISTIIPK